MLHLDVEGAQSAPEYRTARRPYAVFLDQMMIDHPELELIEDEFRGRPGALSPELSSGAFGRSRIKWGST